MTIVVTQDPRRPAGFALMDVAAALPAGPVSFTISRDHPSKPWLGPSGWQSSRASLSVSGIDYTQSGARLVLGPAIVNHIFEYEQVTITLTEIGLEAEVVWPPIPPMRTTYRQGPVDVDAPPQDEHRTPPPPKTPPAPPPPPPDVPGGGTQSDHGIPGFDDPVGPDVDPPEPPPRRRVLAVLLVLAGVAGVAGVAWFYLGPFEEPVFQTASGDTQEAEPPAPPPVGEARAEADTQSGETATAGRTAVLRERLIDPSVPVDELLGIARELTELGTADAVAYGAEAYARAARRGSAEAALWVGSVNDPRTSRWRDAQLGRPDALMALTSYRDAVAAGSDTAQAELDGLCAWLRTRAAPTDDERNAIEAGCPN